MNIPITPEQLEAKRASLAANGINIVGDSGEVKSHGCIVDYSYDGATLALTVKHAPWPLSVYYVERHIETYFQ